jgi:hypothetical protein
MLDWNKIFTSLASEVTSSTAPTESFCHPRQGPFRVVESASGLVVVNRRDIRLKYVEKDQYIDTAPPIPPTQAFIFDGDCSFTTKCLQVIDVDRVIRRIQDNLKEHKGERASVAHPDNGPFSILRLPEWGSKTLWVLNSNGDQVQRILPQYYKKQNPTA